MTEALQYSKLISVEGKGFSSTAFCNSRTTTIFTTKSCSHENLMSSHCSSSLPIVTRSGGHEQGQNRGKFPKGQLAIFAFLATLYGVLFPVAAAFRNRSRPLIYTRFSTDQQSDKSCEDQEREVDYFSNRRESMPRTRLSFTTAPKAARRVTGPVSYRWNILFGKNSFRSLVSTTKQDYRGTTTSSVMFCDIYRSSCSYAKIPFTTCDSSTPVSLKSRPWNR
jgi:hypothetical protein